MHSPRHKVIITGTGRAGTTLLVRLLTELGLDTGYRPDTWQKDYFEHCQAGLEQKLDDPSAPYVVKNPELCVELANILPRTPLVIDHAIIPVRALEEAALSRVRVGGEGKTPGGLIDAGGASAQQAVLANRFHRLVETLTAYDIPHTFLLFPRFARDEAYAFAKLLPVLGSITREQFGAAFQRVAQPELIHSFASGTTVDAGQPAQAFARLRRHKRLRRATYRVAACAALVAMGWFLAGRRTAETPLSTATLTAVRIAPAATPAPPTQPISVQEYLAYLRNVGAFSGPRFPASAAYRPRPQNDPSSASTSGLEPFLRAELEEAGALLPATLGAESGSFVR